MARLVIVVYVLAMIVSCTSIKGLSEQDTDFQFQRAVLDEPIPLTEEQISQINIAVADGTVARICAVLERNGTIPRQNDSIAFKTTNANVFQPIIIPTLEQQAVLDACYTPPPAPSQPAGVPVGKRKKRNIGFGVDEACVGDVSSVLFVQTRSGKTAQVMVKGIGSAGSCQKSMASACGVDCCKVTFEIYAIVAILQTDNPSMTFDQILVEHCACVGT